MRTFLIAFFLFIITSKGYTKDECTFSVSVDCPKSNSEYWNGLIIITNNTHKYWFLDQKKKMTLPKGQYKFNLSSEFGDDLDTTITLDAEEKKIILKINWRYKFKNYSNSILEKEGDTIIINYERKFCSRGSCARDRDKMKLCKTLSGQYIANYFNPIIIGENCLDINENTWGDKLLNIEKNKIIENYFLSNSVSFNKNRVRECTVKIGKHIYVMNYGTYLKFRKELLNE